MSLTSSQINHLNRMNRAADDVNLGTLVDGFVNNTQVTGSVVASAAQSAASAIVIATGLGSVAGYQVQGFRSGSVITNLYVAGNTSG
jgi:hypothetical protein